MKIFLLILMLASFSFSYGQTDGNAALSDQQKPVTLVFDQDEFNGRFSVMVQSDGNYDYYAVDLTSLNDRFERVYFMNLTYPESKLINIDGDIDKDQVWFKAYYTNKEPEITCLFKDLKEKTGETALKMTSAEKSAWLASHDKFKK